MNPISSVEPKNKPTRGLVIVNTGNGKGKTTAALGMVLRSLGHNHRVCVIQFIKSENGQWGEIKAAEKLNLEWLKLGDGFVFDPAARADSAAKAIQAWGIAQQKISSGLYQLIVLDEFTYPLHFGWLLSAAVIDWLKTNKPPELHLVITGRYAPPELVDYADLVTEMQLVKHPYQQGIAGQPGIEY
jgi:cob(I)alamin adenosyltransferase